MDRVVEVVEPVVRDEDVVPGRAARVLELDAGTSLDPGLERADLVAEPPHGQGACGHGMSGNGPHFRG